MLYALPYKTKQFFFVLIKLSIVVGAFYFIYTKVAENKDLEFSVFIGFLTKNKVFSLKNMLFLVILSIFNWFFEIIKWQQLVKSIRSISFFEALKQSLASLTASLITPNRIGEYGAKAIYFSKNYRKRILFLNLLGNISQMLITLLLGCVGLSYMIVNYNLEVDFFRISRIVLIFMLVAVLTVFGVKQNKFKIRGFTIERVKEFWLNIPNNIKVSTLVFSCIRYLIFSLQFYILLRLFAIDVTYFRAMSVITTMYLLASIIPSIFIFDVIVKGSVAVYLFSLVGINEITILSIILIMWILNTVLPSIIGSYFVINFNVYNNSPE
ncbi:lysylphosphatidylglycerol synthase domain-containing protein [Ichthyenterobacterium sp. W332]|uniref:Lysylphosphatidylglycerol synthase domain-containing protein n=1 Tax=Microcosmobacter mediterraneus TaxID=3075607 RepID=A0ABU2YLC3_9FLAO|nr:lysylphosphatidylglycerol synthase domain-containing protein [Ichthyenterobacterium sp. W332]MDT0558964.1 lysylphosphatidylglycerol synthase domain-containing protein [Ichthyenterobacterium sp. W332]